MAEEIGEIAGGHKANDGAARILSVIKAAQ